jgi:hypothetical protein
LADVFTTGDVAAPVLREVRDKIARCQRGSFVLPGQLSCSPHETVVLVRSGSMKEDETPFYVPLPVVRGFSVDGVSSFAERLHPPKAETRVNPGNPGRDAF